MAAAAALAAVQQVALMERLPAVVEVQLAKAQKVAMVPEANFVFGGQCNESTSN
jgi:hypothetical protein